MSDETRTDWNENGPAVTAETSTERVGFCQNCGKPLDKETIRRVGTAVYCEPCLAARLGANVPTGTSSADPTAGYPRFVAGPYQSAPIVSGVPSPAVAALLGLIPGVGAMYNEQYAKGIVQFAIFAVLMSLSDHASIFGLIGAAWYFYMIFDSYHTAKARRDGLPLPNPFGLNDIGDRLGFVRTPASASAGAAVPPVAAAEPIPAQDVPPRANWGAPEDRVGYTNVPPTYPIPPVAPYTPTPGYGYGPTIPPVPPAYPYAAVPPIAPIDIAPIPARGGFPAGAIWLIALGVIFLVGNTGMFRDVPESALVGIALIALAVWIFVRKLLALQSVAPIEGHAMAGFRLVRASRGAVWVLLIGAVMVLNAFHLIVWTLSWPYFIILAGVMALLERTVSNAAAANAWHYGGYAGQPAATGYAAVPGNPQAATEVPAHQPVDTTEEGR